MQGQAPQNDFREVLDFMFRLGQAYLACGEQTAKVGTVVAAHRLRLWHETIAGRGISDRPFYHRS